jgi:hypothetical protein
MGEGYYARKAREASEETARIAREGHEGVQRQADNAHSGMQNNTNTSSLDSGQTQRVNPTDMAASGETSMVAFYTVATVLGSIAAAAFLGRRGRGSN